MYFVGNITVRLKMYKNLFKIFKLVIYYEKLYKPATNNKL